MTVNRVGTVPITNTLPWCPAWQKTQRNPALAPSAVSPKFVYTHSPPYYLVFAETLIERALPCIGCKPKCPHSASEMHILVCNSTHTPTGMGLRTKHRSLTAVYLPNINRLTFQALWAPKYIYGRLHQGVCHCCLPLNDLWGFLERGDRQLTRCRWVSVRHWVAGLLLLYNNHQKIN